MPALGSVVVNDRETSPVTHTFTAYSRKSPNAVVLREAGTVPVADSFIHLSLERIADGSIKGTYKLTVPIVQTETLNGLTSVKQIRQSMAAVELRFSGQSTVQERKNVLGMLAESFAASETVINDAFMNAEGWS